MFAYQGEIRWEEKVYLPERKELVYRVEKDLIAWKEKCLLEKKKKKKKVAWEKSLPACFKKACLPPKKEFTC